MTNHMTRQPVALASDVIANGASLSIVWVYIGGVIPSRPTSTTAASQLPSACLAHAGMKILVPGFKSALSPGTS